MLLNKKRTVYQGGLYVARYTGRNGVLEAVGTYLWHFLKPWSHVMIFPF